MQAYANLGGDSGVLAFEVLDGGIDIKFKDGWIYTYTVASAGAQTIAAMVRLAQAGHGLATYINKNKPGYTRKRR
jgi:hypothetical protein